MGLLELPDLRHTLVDIGTTLLCISGYNGLPAREDKGKREGIPHTHPIPSVIRLELFLELG